jgi:hypothetical protein
VRQGDVVPHDARLHGPRARATERLGEARLRRRRRAEVRVHEAEAVVGVHYERVQRRRAELQQEEGTLTVRERRLAAAAVRVAHEAREVAVRLGGLVVVGAVEALAEREGRRLSDDCVGAVLDGV